MVIKKWATRNINSRLKIEFYFYTGNYFGLVFFCFREMHLLNRHACDGCCLSFFVIIIGFHHKFRVFGTLNAMWSTIFIYLVSVDEWENEREISERKTLCSWVVFSQITFWLGFSYNWNGLILENITDYIFVLFSVLIFFLFRSDVEKFIETKCVLKHTLWF